MVDRMVRLCWLVVAVACLPVMVYATAGWQADSERKALYGWFDSLGFTARMNGTFGEVQRWSDYVGGKQPCQSEFGYLLSGGARDFTVLTLGLQTLRVNGGSDPAQRFLSSEFRPIDLRNWLKTQKTLLQASLGNREPRVVPTSQQPYYGGSFGLGADFIIARVADLHGMPDAADWFYDKSVEEPRNPYLGEGPEFSESVKVSLARGLLRSAEEAFDDPSQSRSDLLQQMKLIAGHFPLSEYKAAAETYASTLQRMVAEDAVRKPLAGLALSSLSDNQRAGELAWQLRNQNGHQWSNPGWADVFATYDPKNLSPADRLKKMGLSSAPALIEALDDKSLTRTIGGQFGPYRHVLLVRDAAFQVLQRISARELGNGPSECMSDAEAAGIKSKFEAWWTEIETIGEEHALAERVSRGDGTRSSKQIGSRSFTQLLHSTPSKEV